MANFAYTYHSPLEDVVGLMIDHVPGIEPFAMEALADEISTSCLIFACTWLSSGGVETYKFGNAEFCRQDIAAKLQQMFYASRPLTTFGDNESFNLVLGNRWSIDFDDWLRACAVFTYWIADTTLRYNEKLFYEISGYDAGRVSFTPAGVKRSGTRATFYRFSVNVFIKELLPAPR